MRRDQNRVHRGARPARTPESASQYCLGCSSLRVPSPQNRFENILPANIGEKRLPSQTHRCFRYAHRHSLWARAATAPMPICRACTCRRGAVCRTSSTVSLIVQQHTGAASRRLAHCTKRSHPLWALCCNFRTSTVHVFNPCVSMNVHITGRNKMPHTVGVHGAAVAVVLCSAQSLRAGPYR